MLEAKALDPGLSALVEAMPVAAVLVDRDGHVCAGNRRWYRLGEEGTASVSFLGLGSDWFASCADRQLAREMGEPWSSLGEVITGRSPECSFDLDVPVGGRVQWRRVLAGEMTLGEWSGTLLTVFDLTGAARHDRDQQRLAAIVDGSSDAIITKDLNGRVLSWNPAAEKIYGYAADEMIGRSIAVLAPEDRADEIPALLDRVRGGDCVDHLETVRCHKDGTLLDIALTLSPIRDDHDVVVAASIIARDVTDRKELERRLTELATRDTLTGAATRSHFTELADRELRRLRRNGGSFAMLMMDLDHFKGINDRHGHAAGDAVLAHFANLVRQDLRAVDVLARWGGDEFVILLPESSEFGAQQLVERMSARVSATRVETPEASLGFSASIGVAVGDSTTTLAQLMARADQALYEAKRRRRGDLGASDDP